MEERKPTRMEQSYDVRSGDTYEPSQQSSSGSKILLYLLSFLHFPLKSILDAIDRLLSESPRQSDEAEETNYESMNDSDQEVQILKINKLNPVVTNDFHILRNHLASHRESAHHHHNNNSILTDDVSEIPDFSSPRNKQRVSAQNILRSLVNSRIKSVKPVQKPSSQYGTDLSLSREFLKNSKYQQNYQPSPINDFTDEEDEGIEADDLLNLTDYDVSSHRKYHQSVLNYYIPSKPVSTADYSVIDSAVSNFYIDDNTSSRYQDNHRQLQELVSKNRVESLSKIVPLNQSQLAKVNEIWTSKSNRQLFNLFQIDVYHDDIKTLRDGRWLNDNIIDLYLGLVTKANPKAYAWTTHFFTTLQEKGYQGVARWAKRRKLNVFEKDIILVPINIMNTHWALAVVDNVEHRIKYYDSLSSSGNLNAVKIISNYMSSEAERLNHPKIDYELLPNIKTPQQANGYDCGVFACTAARYVSTKSPLTYSQNDMKVIRRRMAYEILNKELLQN